LDTVLSFHGTNSLPGLTWQGEKGKLNFTKDDLRERTCCPSGGQRTRSAVWLGEIPRWREDGQWCWGIRVQADLPLYAARN